MPLVYEVTDVFNPKKELKKTEVEIGFNTKDYLLDENASYYLYVNNRLIEHETKLHEKDIALFIPKVKGSLVIGLIVAVVIAAAIYFFMDITIPALNGLPESDPVYTLKGQQNQLKLGEPIERHYGEVRHWPSYASRPYNQFVDDEQWLFALLCVGIGSYNVSDVRIDDTPIGNFENAEYEVYQPGENVTLFPTHVQTSSEIGGIELIGPNEAGHDWSGPFIVVNTLKTAYRLEIDLSFRAGLYRTKNDGKLSNRTVNATFEYRKINNSGDPIGDWITLTEFSKTLKTVNSKRYTIGVNVDSGRYEIRGKRTTNKSDDFKIRDTLTWESARAFINTNQNFGNVTLIAFKLQASNSLNDNSNSKFNVRVQSKSYKYNGTSWNIEVTRNPIWAFCDILLSDYGRNLAPKFLDLDTIVQLANDIEEEELYFDATFDSRGNIWQALIDCLMGSRSRPNLPGTLISIVRDVVLTIPTSCFNPSNISPESFKVTHNFVRVSDKDGLEVEYVNADSWKRETVICLIGNDRGINLEKVRLIGCKDRNKAYQWGMYQRASQIYKKTNVSFTTGLEGSTVTFGDLVAVQYDLLPNDFDTIPEHTGKIAENIYWNDDDNTVITLPFAPVFEEDETYRIALSDTQGFMRGPYICSQGLDNTVIVEGQLDLSYFEMNSSEELPSYFFGITGKEVSLFNIIGITPGSKYGEVNLTLSPYDDRVFEYLDDNAPVINNDFQIPVTPSHSIVNNLQVTALAYTILQVQVTWESAIGASSYFLEISYDGNDYTRVLQTPLNNAIVDIDPGEIWIRVAANGLSVGPWTVWTGEVGIPATVPFQPDKPELSEPFEGSNLYLTTNEHSLATSYTWKISILDDALTDLVEISSIDTDTPFLVYSSGLAKADALLASVSLKRDITATVFAENSLGLSEESEIIEVTNNLPSVITGLSVTEIQDLTTTKRYLFQWDSAFETDIESYKLYVDTVTGFTPDLTNLIISTNANSAESILTVGTTYFWVIGVKDRWGNEIVLTGEQTFTA
jgi:hypothetical protein